MKKKWLMPLSTPILTLALLTGCGSADDNMDEQPQDTNVPTENQSNDIDTDPRKNMEDIDAPNIPEDNVDQQRDQDRDNDRDGMERFDRKHRQ